MIPGLYQTHPTRLSCTYIGTLTSVATTSIVNLGDFTVPGQGSALLVVAYVSGHSNVRQISAVAVGGVNTTTHTTPNQGNVQTGSISSRIVSPGTQNITVTHTSTSATASMSAHGFVLRGVRSTASFAIDVSSGTAASLQTTHGIPSPGVSIFLATQVVATTGDGTWSSATQTFKSTVGQAVHYSAQYVTTVAESSHVETFTATSARILAVASFR